jgi:tRNA(fMet)-specific endonuclease VapC
MATLIDSSVLIAAERGALEIRDFFRRNADEDFALSAVTAAELLHGIYRARNAAQRIRRQAFIDTMMEILPVVPFDLRDARVYAAVWAELALAGTQIAERDLMIGATALARDYRVATLDSRSFPRIPGLKVLIL